MDEWMNKRLRTVHLTVGVVVPVAVLWSVVVEGSVDVIYHAVQVLREAIQFSLLELRERTVLLPREYSTRVYEPKYSVTIVFLYENAVI